MLWLVLVQFIAPYHARHNTAVNGSRKTAFTVAAIVHRHTTLLQQSAPAQRKLLHEHQWPADRLHVLGMLHWKGNDARMLICSYWAA